MTNHDDRVASATNATDSPADQDWIQLGELIEEITDIRRRSLLVMYYPVHSCILDVQITHLRECLIGGGLHKDKPLASLDVLLHTSGGDPVASYRLAQIIRDYAKETTFLVPEYAYSGGTLIALSGNKILLGDDGVLSPIDITLIREDANHNDEGDHYARYPEEKPSDSEVESVAIDYFIEVAKQARLQIEMGFRQRGWKNSTTDVECALLCEMTRQIGALNIATYYREKDLTRAYAAQLLKEYMFADRNQEADAVIERILRKLVLESPSHEFPMDYHICRSLGLRVGEMPEQLSRASVRLTKVLARLARAGKIARVSRGIQLPYFAFFGFTEGPTDRQSPADVEAREPSPSADPANDTHVGGIRAPSATADDRSNRADLPGIADLAQQQERLLQSVEETIVASRQEVDQRDSLQSQ